MAEALQDDIFLDTAQAAKLLNLSSAYLVKLRFQGGGCVIRSSVESSAISASIYSPGRRSTSGGTLMRHDRKMIEMGLTLDQKQTKMVTDLAIALALQNVFETERLTKKTMELLTNDEQAYARTLKHAIRHFKGLFSSLVFFTKRVTSSS